MTVKERNLLSAAYKNVIGARLESWRIVSSVEQKEESKGNEAQVSRIIEVLDKHLVPSAASEESKPFIMANKRNDSAGNLLEAYGTLSESTYCESIVPLRKKLTL
ncbi:14-3-3 protein [Mycena vitilis]|nr:14-3-3 protein [Mycena vitilis]